MKKHKSIVVIGGSAAGPKAAAKARRLDEQANITIVQKGVDLSMASCGYPYYVGGTFDDRNMLLCSPTGVTRDPSFFLATKNIHALTETEALTIDRNQKKVVCRHLPTGKETVLPYDSLVIATGASPRIPPVKGCELSGITALQSMQDADYLRKIRDEKKVKHAVIVGGGLIGIETCEALHLAGIQTTVVELLPQMLTFLDWELAKLVENHLRDKAVEVFTNNGLSEFLGKDGTLTGVRLADGSEISCQLAVAAIGVKPNSQLAADAGLKLGKTGGIVVNDHMATSDPNIYAAGDCIEVKHRITGKQVHAPFGDLANLEGRVAGENAVLGNVVSFSGTIQTGICKIFDFTAGATGLSETNARKQGFEEIVTVIHASSDKPGFMQGKLLVSKIVADKKDGRIVGAQCVGPGDVSKQIAQWALAIQGNLTVEDLIHSDLPYAPPFSLALDHFIAGAHVLQNKRKGRLKGISSIDLKKRLEKDPPPFLLDTRGPDEYEVSRLGVGEVLIPLGQLRKRLNEMPSDKSQEIICYCKISLRGYEAALALEGHGWNNVRVLEGGMVSWPYSKEKG